ncbi:hypothetical protein Q9L58_006734 [Maublancomyces gigas]|uniref:Uncharacterized protein n=1 Tax=Discina gigas TaxID=1032678 RepID=A0ABR3GFL6_9PEZI
MKFSTLHFSKLFGKKFRDDCTPEQIRAFDASYHEVKEISITLYAHLAGCPSGPFPDWDINQVMDFFGQLGADESERSFGITQLSLWRAMTTGQQPAEASLIVHNKMWIGKEFLAAGGVRDIMWHGEKFYILRALIDEAILKGELSQPEQELPEQSRKDAEFSRDLAASTLTYQCLCEISRTASPENK